MKVKITKMPYEKVISLKKAKHKKPTKPCKLLKWVIRLISAGELKKVNFSYNFPDRKALGKGPYLILMNHSSFLDLKMVASIFPNTDYNIVSTTDALIGKEFLMRTLGCIPTQKFVHDISLIKDMKYAIQKNKCSVVMYPEAGYSLDGCATILPENYGRLIKVLGVPTIFIRSYGAFHYDPLYNLLQIRKVNVSCDVEVIATKEETSTLSSEELSNRIEKCFSFDNFKWQKDNKIIIDEPFRADGLEKVLYKCPHCLKEGKMIGKGIHLKCNACGKTYELTTLGEMKALNGETEFSHIPTWFNWQRNSVKEDIINGNYKLNIPVRIMMVVDYKSVYDVCDGTLVHNENGFYLESDDKKLIYTQSPLATHTLNAEYYWYEIGDVISIGDKNALYYCFPKASGIVTKTRLAAEELYKISKQKLN